MKTDNRKYLYDGTFINLLSLINKLIDDKVKPFNIKSELSYEFNLIDETYKMDIKNDNKCFSQIINKISFDAFKMLYYVFLSTDENKELIIYYFILNGYKYGKRIIYLRNLKCVTKVLKISKYVSRENHRLKGFVRFKEYQNNFLYATISPTNNVLELLASHFAKRLNTCPWIINDTSRGICAINKDNKIYIIENNNIDISKFEISDNQQDFETLWKTFFETVAIKERTNRRCQMNFMPKKYWKNIIEMEGKI